MKKILTQTILFSTDVLALVGLFYLTLTIRLSIDSAVLPKFDLIELENFYFVFIIQMALLYNEKVYRFRYDFWQETSRIFKSFFIGFILVLAVLTLLKTSSQYSRSFMVIYFTLSILFIPLFKRIIKGVLFKVFKLKQKVLILGDNTQVKIFKKEFKNNWYLGQMYAQKKYDSVVIVSKNMSTHKLNSMISNFLHEDVELYVVPYITDINFAHSNILEYTNIRVNTIQIENKLLLKSNLFIKNIFDKVFVTLFFPFLILIHILISVFIFTSSSGGVLFKQERLGRKKQNFTCYKYRTMYDNSENILKKYLEQNPQEVLYYQKYHKYNNDPRITKIGKFLRATSLDELPQFFNVIKGEMSLIGPRPYMLCEAEKIGNRQDFILKVKPGITGLWQVSGRNHISFEQRNDLEVWYIKNWSLWNDFVILLKTIKVVLLKVGAR